MLSRNNLIYYVDQLISKVEKRHFNGGKAGDGYLIKKGTDELKPQLHGITVHDVRFFDFTFGKEGQEICTSS